MAGPGEERDSLAIELERVTDGFMAFDRDWRFTHLNSRAAALFDRSAAELVDQHLFTVFPEVEGLPLHVLGERALREQTVQIYEEHIPSLDGWFEGRIYPARDGISVFLTDITHRRRAERARADMVERLHRVQRLESLGRLVGGVAHDFNTMLAVIINHADLLCDALGDRPEVQADAVRIRENAERAAELVRRLLLFSRPGTGHPRAVDLNVVLTDTEPLLRRTLPEGIELVFRRADAPCVVTADPDQLEQVLINLVVNARDAMRGAGGTLTLSTGDADGFGELTVSDTGEGMTDDVRERAFDPFFTTRPGGTGLGLAVVHGIATAAGGDVTLESARGQGSTVCVRFPLAGRAAEVARAATTAPRGSGELVLVVEDSGPLRQLTRRLLEDAGYRVAEADSGAGALTLREREAPDVVLTDVVMPGMSGRELAAALRSHAPALPVVMMSGYTDDPALREALLGAGTPLLEKPFTRDELLSAVRAALGG